MSRKWIKYGLTEHVKNSLPSIFSHSVRYIPLIGLLFVKQLFHKECDYNHWAFNGNSI